MGGPYRRRKPQRTCATAAIATSLYVGGVQYCCLAYFRVDHHVAVARGDTDAQGQDPPMHGAIIGQVAVGRYVLQIGDPCGAVVRDASRAERAHIRPRATPILL